MGKMTKPNLYHTGIVWLNTASLPHKATKLCNCTILHGLELGKNLANF